MKPQQSSDAGIVQIEKSWDSLRSGAHRCMEGGKIMRRVAQHENDSSVRTQVFMKPKIVDVKHFPRSRAGSNDPLHFGLQVIRVRRG
jgi:hypothetical protein